MIQNETWFTTVRLYDDCEAMIQNETWFTEMNSLIMYDDCETMIHVRLIYREEQFDYDDCETMIQC